MDFLYSRNRLNVATSRARCKAVLICSPDLLDAHCRRPEEMRMLNAFCRLVEMADPPAETTAISVPEVKQLTLYFDDGHAEPHEPARRARR
jgi:hypothetical protein